MAQVTFLGTGLMGAALAEAAARRGDRVTAWNRSPAKARPLEALGIRVAARPSDAVAGAERVHTVLSDDAALDSVLEACGGALGQALVVDHSTTLPSATAERARRLEARGVPFLHAPVFMSPKMCREGTGVMLCAGRSAVFERAQAALRPMSGALHYLGERPDLAAANKLFGNAMIIAVTAGLADVYAMAASLGIDAKDAHGLFAKFNPAGVIAYRGAAMAKGDYTASFELVMARKDVRLMMETAGAKDLSVLSAVATRMDALLGRGLGGRDLGVLSIDAVPDAAARAGD